MISLNIATEIGCVNCLHNKVCSIANNLNRQIEVDDVPISISVKLVCEHYINRHGPNPFSKI